VLLALAGTGYGLIEDPALSEHVTVEAVEDATDEAPPSIEQLPPMTKPLAGAFESRCGHSGAATISPWIRRRDSGLRGDRRA
jgi:hypothetical protein